MSNYTRDQIRRITLDSEKKYGLPKDTLFKIAGIESSYRPGQRSHTGAQGWFQFMPATAKQYGLTNPDDLTQSADAAGRFMKDLLGRHDGNMDEALAYYNGGHKAVAALRGGKPWAETSDYLSKFNGGRAGAPAAPAEVAPKPALGRQFTELETVPSTQGPSNTQLAFQQRQREDEFGGVSGFAGNVLGAARLGFETQNTAWNWFKDRAVEDVGEPLDWNSALAKDTLNQFPERHWGYLSEAGTVKGLEMRSARLAETMAQEQKLGEMGLPLALTGGIVGGLPDIPTLIGALPGMGGAGLLTKTSRLANLVRSGAWGAATNVAIDAVGDQYRPTATPDDLWMSALFGAAVGGVAGSLAKVRAPALAKELRDLDGHLGKQARDAMEREAIEGGLEPAPPRITPEKPLEKTPEPVPEHAPDGTPQPGSLKGPEGLAGGDPPQPPRVAKEAPTGPDAAPDKAPDAAPRQDPWEAEWDTPRYTEATGTGKVLELPALDDPGAMAKYVIRFSQNDDLVRVLKKSLEAIDMRRLKFSVLDPKRAGNLRPSSNPKNRLAPDMSTKLGGALGLMRSTYTADGVDLQLALRGRGWGSAHGLTEDIFIHEMVHGATVHRFERTMKGWGTSRMSSDTKQAYRELNDLYGFVKKHSRTRSDIPKNAGNYLSNAKEFISYGLTDRRFQDWLRSVKVPGSKTTLWTRFTSGLSKLLGIAKKDTHALARLIDLTDAMMSKKGFDTRKNPRPTLQPANKFVSDEEATAAANADLSPVFGWGLGLEHRLGSEKIPPKIRNLAGKLFGTTVGYEDHAVVRANVWDDSVARSGGWQADMRKVGYTKFHEWFKSQKDFPWHQKGVAFEHFGEQVNNYIRGIPGQYGPEVIAAGRHAQDILETVVDEINNPAMRRGGSKRGLTTQEVTDDLGNTMWVGELQKNRNYLPRKHDIMKWNAAIQKWGVSAVEDWWTNAFAKTHGHMQPEFHRRFAKWYMDAVQDAHLNRTESHLEDMMTGADEKALHDVLVRNGGFSEDDAWDLIRGMFLGPEKDKGRTAASLRHRSSIAEDHSETLIDSAGNRGTLTLNDFIHTNAFDVLDSYFQRTASSISLADHLDVYKQADIGRLIDTATKQELGTTVPQAVVEQARKDLQFSFDRIQGLPQEEFAGWRKGLEMWRSFNVIRLMGGAMFNQVQEMSQLVGSLGWKATLQAVPELRRLMRDARTGKAPNEWLDHLENTIGGVGSEYVARMQLSPRHDWVENLGDTRTNRALDTLDTGLKKFASGVLDYSGMTAVMVQQKRLHAVALTNHLVNLAVEGGEARVFTPNRLAMMGLDSSEFAAMKAAIRKYSAPGGRGEYGKKVNFDFKRFAKDEPELNAKMMHLIHRESRRVVQENDLASMVTVMGTSVGQTMFQFMNFVMQAWNKSMLYAMHHRDFATASTMLWGGLLSSLTYTARTQLSAMGRSEEDRERFLDKRLATKQLVANSIGRVAQLSLLPQLYDIGPGMLTGAVFSGMRTTSDVSSLASNPTIQAVQSVLSLGKVVRNGFSDDLQTTSQDVRSWGRLLPLNNVVPISSLINTVAADYPYDEKEAE